MNSHSCVGLFFIGVGTPGIFWIITSISANLFATACSIKSLIEERFDLAMGGGVIDAICRAWFIVGFGRADWKIELVTNGMVV